ncbi:hypothetical protein, conserved [Plasmodium gonderi]|uniref:ADF-H domain-containing protein n=1 Tax=Plasmodium gonderi TaxID=77519 RepID=A0A1Y1JR95_PLAGO|nr:hypothetical protein, conserved [Plasmodium gonderi]GAW83757.1 hypothetical protein, conserved [Plasmodium gonderi]
MKRNLSPSIQREIVLCNKQKSNKRCLLVSLNSKFQFTLEGYTEQRENTNDDFEHIRKLLNKEIMFILYNDAKFTCKYKWILILWIPDESVAEEMRMKENMLKKKSVSLENFEKEKKYTEVTKLNRLIYYNLKNNILHFIHNNSNIPLIEVNNFAQLEKCINSEVVDVTYNNCLSTPVTNEMNRKYHFYNSIIRNYLYNYYFLNEQLKQCFNGLNDEYEGMSNDLEVLIPCRSTCLLLFTIDVNKYKIESHFEKIEKLESILHITKERNIFYAVYKIADTYTLFYLCHSDRCSTREKFVYSFFKPHLIEILKKKNIPIFLSIEIGKVKHLVKFILEDITEKKQNYFEKNILFEKGTKINKGEENHMVGKKNYPIHAHINAKNKLLSTTENDSISKERTNHETNEYIDMKKKYTFPSRGSNFLSLKRESNKNTQFMEYISVEKEEKKKKTKNMTGSGGGVRIYGTHNSTFTNENSISQILKKKSLPKLPSLKKVYSSTIEREKTFSISKKGDTLPKLIKSKSLTLNKGSSTSVELKKSPTLLNTHQSLQFDKKKSLTNKIKTRKGT